jgi:hypothetical protein
MGVELPHFSAFPLNYTAAGREVLRRYYRDYLPVILLWLYISFYIILLGAEINAELEWWIQPPAVRSRWASAALSSPTMLLAGLKVTGDHRALSRAIPRQQNLARRSKCGSKTVLIGGCSAAFRVRCHFYDYRLGASFS